MECEILDATLISEAADAIEELVGALEQTHSYISSDLVRRGIAGYGDAILLDKTQRILAKYKGGNQ